jgi:hypothetical protein
MLKPSNTKKRQTKNLDSFSLMNLLARLVHIAQPQGIENCGPSICELKCIWEEIVDKGKLQVVYKCEEGMEADGLRKPYDTAKPTTVGAKRNEECNDTEEEITNNGEVQELNEKRTVKTAIMANKRVQIRQDNKRKEGVKGES